MMKWITQLPAALPGCVVVTPAVCVPAPLLPIITPVTLGSLAVPVASKTSCTAFGSPTPAADCGLLIVGAADAVASAMTCAGLPLRAGRAVRAGRVNRAGR